MVTLLNECNRLEAIISVNERSRMNFSLDNIYMEGLKNQHRHIKDLVRENNDLKEKIKELEAKVEKYENMTEEELSISNAGRLLQSGWRRKMQERRLQKAKEEAERLEKELKDQ